MYGSTCADMQVDVMGECLSSIKHVVGTTSGCFYPRSNHWEVGGRPQCDKCGCRVRNCSQHRFTTLETISNYRNSYPGFSSGRPRGTTPADDRYIVLQARRNRRQTAGEIARHTTQATGRPISRFTVARRLHGGGLFARRPVRCVPLTPAHRRRRSLWCRDHRNWRDNEWGRVLFTDESRFSLSSDSHRILIWRERGSRNHPSNIIERDRYGGRGVLVWGGIMLGSRTDFHIFDAGSFNGTRYCNEILLPYVRLFRGAMGLQFLYMDDNAPCHRTVAAEQLLESRRLTARTLPPVTIRELRLALQDEWAAMPQQLIDTLILSMGRRCETCLAELWFQQVGATCHTARATIDLLKDTFGDRLISRFGPVSWPPRSCDLTPLDYFLWGYVKSLVYADKPQTLDHLEDNIRRVITDIRPQMLENVIENWTSRLDYIRASRGSHMPEIIFNM
ncbi:transposable element Tcb2 transposase [Trichonephila clavipes]|nr:transposable element Tcb2 transposase [Trichonephila clavipes]